VDDHRRCLFVYVRLFDFPKGGWEKAQRSGSPEKSAARKNVVWQGHVLQHPDKTFIGRVSRGFDFLGYEFTPAGLDVAPQTVERCVERVSRLYEQDVDRQPLWGGRRRVNQY